MHQSSRTTSPHVIDVQPKRVILVEPSNATGSAVTPSLAPTARGETPDAAPHVYGGNAYDAAFEPLSGGGGLGAAPSQFGPPADDRPYDTTFIGFHHSRRGVRFALQASTRSAIVIALLLLLLVARPDIIDTVLSMLRALMFGH
jgi:hypothetical protein